MRSTISVVIVAGACGIAAGTPLAILGGIGRAARLGAIIKGGLYLETLGRVDTIVLDKTGTLTFGRPEVQVIVPAEGLSSDEVLDAAAAAEARSEHPLGQAIVAYARDAGPPDCRARALRLHAGPGHHCRCRRRHRPRWQSRAYDRSRRRRARGPCRRREAASEIFVARDGRLLGAIAVADTVRPEAKRAIEALDANAAAHRSPDGRYQSGG